MQVSPLSSFLYPPNINSLKTASTQRLERTLDDLANLWLFISEAFLTSGSTLQPAHKLSASLIIYPNVIDKHFAEKILFMSAETILMAVTNARGDR